MLLQARLQQQLDTLDNSEDRAGLERQIAEAQAQRAHLQDSADVAVDMLQRSVSADANVLQVAQELDAALGQSVQSLTDALQRDGAPPADVALQTDHAPQIDHDGQFCNFTCRTPCFCYVASPLHSLQNCCC